MAHVKTCSTGGKLRHNTEREALEYFPGVASSGRVSKFPSNLEFGW